MSPSGIGERIGDFSLEDMGGERTTLGSALERGPVLLFCFKTACPASDTAGPFAEGMWLGYREHESAEGTRLSVLGISLSDHGSTSAFIARHGITFPVLPDLQLAVTGALGLTTTPTLILLKGRERLRADAARVAPADGFRIVDVVEAWSRAAYELLAEEIATRIGTLPLEIFQKRPDLPEFRPG